MSAVGKAWVRQHGTREGSLVAYSRLLPFLRERYDDYLAEGGAAHDERTVAEVIRAVAVYRAKAGWGMFARKGYRKFFIRDGRGAWPRGPERPHLRRDHRLPRLDLVRRAVEDLTTAGIARPTVTQIIETVRRDTGVTLSRGAAVDPYRETNGVAKALDALPATYAELARALRWELPLGRLHVVRIADVAEALYARSDNPSTIRTQRSRASAALLEIGRSRVGLTVAIVGDLAIIGRQRALPADLRGYAKSAEIRDLSSILFARREAGTAQDRQDQAAAQEMLMAVDAWRRDTEDVFERAIDSVEDDVMHGREREHDFYPLPEELPALGGDADLLTRITYFFMTKPVLPHLTSKCRAILWGPDANLAATLGVASRWSIETHRGTARGAGSEFDARFAAHFAKMQDLRIAAGQGTDMGALYRWCHAQGGLPMTDYAERVAAAMDGIHDTTAAARAIPSLRRPGRRRVATPLNPTPRASRVGRVALARSRSIETAPAVELKVNRSSPQNIRPYDPDIDGIPLFLVGC